MKQLLILVSLLVLLAPPAVADDDIFVTLEGSQPVSSGWSGISPRVVPVVTAEDIEAFNKLLAPQGFKMDQDADGKYRITEFKKKSRLERLGEWCVDWCDAHPKKVRFAQGAANVLLVLLNAAGAVGNILRY